MIPELGQFALCLALMVALTQVCVPALGVWRGDMRMMSVARNAALAQFSCVTLAYACLLGVALPVLLCGKIYNMLQWVMTAKVIVVLGFCLIIGVTSVSRANWWNVFSGFAKFGNVPIGDGRGGEKVVNAMSHVLQHAEFPTISVASIVMLGAFAGYAGGGGLSNSTYSNFVRDKGWGMGSQVGAIPSAIGGRSVTLSHVGKVFELTADNLRRWRGWWRYVLTDQVLVCRFGT